MQGKPQSGQESVKEELGNGVIRIWWIMKEMKMIDIVGAVCMMIII